MEERKRTRLQLPSISQQHCAKCFPSMHNKSTRSTPRVGKEKGAWNLSVVPEETATEARYESRCGIEPRQKNCVVACVPCVIVIKPIGTKRCAFQRSDQTSSGKSNRIRLLRLERPFVAMLSLFCQGDPIEPAEAIHPTIHIFASRFWFDSAVCPASHWKNQNKRGYGSTFRNSTTLRENAFPACTTIQHVGNPTTSVECEWREAPETSRRARDTGT